MLPRFIAKGAVNSFYFYDYDRQGWVTNDPIGQAALEQELAQRAKFEPMEKDYQLAMSEPAPTPPEPTIRRRI